MSVPRWECTRQMARPDGEWVEWSDHERVVNDLRAEFVRMENAWREEVRVRSREQYSLGLHDGRKEKR